MYRSLLLICFAFAAALAAGTSGTSGSIDLSASSTTALTAGLNTLVVGNTGFTTVRFSVYTPQANQLNVSTFANLNFGFNASSNNQFSGFSGFLSASEGLSIQFASDSGVSANLSITTYSLSFTGSASLQLFAKTANGNSYGAIDASSTTSVGLGLELTTYTFPLPTDPISRTYTFASFDFSVAGAYYPRLYNSSFSLTGSAYNYTFGGNTNFVLSASSNSASSLTLFATGSFGGSSSATPNGANSVVSPYYNISASSSVSANLAFNFSAAASAAAAAGQSFDAAQLSWYKYSNGAWTKVSTSVDVHTQVVVANTNSFSVWTVGASGQSESGTAGTILVSFMISALALLLAF